MSAHTHRNRRRLRIGNPVYTQPALGKSKLDVPGPRNDVLREQAVSAL